MGILDGKAAIVTGAGSGQARSTSLLFAKEGAAVGVVDINIESATRTAVEIQTNGGRALALKCDVGKRSQVDQAVAATIKEFGRIDILVNAARTVYENKPFHEQTEADVALCMDSNFMGTWNFMQACFPYLKERGGKVINFSSTAFTEGVREKAAYAAAKGAVRGLTSVTCLEWGQYNINVNVICPIARTPMFDHDLKHFPPGTYEKYIESIPLRRIGDPDRDQAQVILFLASPASDYVTGQTICVDGGRSTFRM